MTVQTVERCCCYSLKTAGLIIGICLIVVNFLIVYVNYILNINGKLAEHDQMYWIFPLIISTPIYICWVYGILRERPRPMLPLLICSFLITVACVLAPFVSLFYFSHENVSASTGIYIFTLLCVLGCLSYFLWIVQYSLYKTIFRASRGRFHRRDIEFDPCDY